MIFRQGDIVRHRRFPELVGIFGHTDRGMIVGTYKEVGMSEALIPWTFQAGQSFRWHLESAVLVKRRTNRWL